MKMISAVAVLLALAGVARAADKTIVVAADGSGDFKTLAEAIAAVPDNSPDRTTLHLKPGVYEGQTIVPKSKKNVTFEGDGTDKTFCSFGYNTNDPNPAEVPRKSWGIGVIVDGDGFEARDITFRNVSGDHGQALALRINGDRAVVRDCRLLGWQDTLRVEKGRSYFHDVYIEGRVDFIYGSGTAVFEKCEIHSKNGGYVTAASTPQDKPWGFVFFDCKLTGDAVPFDFATTNPASTQPSRVTPIAQLGRPWREFASVAFIRCQIGGHIDPAGWNNWGDPKKETTARYVEYGNTGPGADRSKRVAWSKALTKDEAETLTPQSVLAGSDGWDPTAAK